MASFRLIKALARIMFLRMGIVLHGTEEALAMDAVLVIPTIDPDMRLVSLVDDMRMRGFCNIIVVDDGSGEGSRPVFEALEQRDVHVYHHDTNKGKGRAIKTALRHVRGLFPHATHFVTMDDDGQHLPDDVVAVCKAADDYPACIVLGTRDFKGKGVPARSRFGNAFSSAYFKMDTGMTCPDTQTGLRAVPIEQLGLALSTPGERYDYEMNFLTAAVKQDVSVAMVPITTVYENNNEGSHFSTVRDSVLVFKQFFRFAGSSITCALVDLGIFALITALFDMKVAALVALATVVARLASGVLNFMLNRMWSFADSGSRRGRVDFQAARYFALFCAQMIASMTLVTALSFLPVPLVGVKALVDGTLFVVSYFVQRNWVFKAPVRAQAIMVKGGAHANESFGASSPVV